MALFWHTPRVAHIGPFLANVGMQECPWLALAFCFEPQTSSATGKVIENALPLPGLL
jgi:hypothetical protein